MTPLQLGIIGCGTIGAAHAQAAAASEKIELAAVADVQRPLAEKMAATHKVETVYSSGAELLDDARVEAVVLALPASFRIELGLQALRAGKHLLTEKPVARSADEVRQLISFQGDRVAACCSARFHFLESTRAVTEWIGRGKLGALRLLRCRAIFPAGPAPETAPRTMEEAVAAGLRAKKPHREIAVDLFGAPRAAAEWHADGGMRTRVRRLVDRVRRAAAGGPPGSPGRAPGDDAGGTRE